jgi:F-type H+-transporting ATPase subunit a
VNALDTFNADVPHLQESFDSAYIFGSGSLGLTQYIFWMIICIILTLVVVLIASKRLTLVPHNKFVNMVEYGYQMVRGSIGEAIIGHGFKKHIPFLATIFFFILISNFVGLIPGCKTPTGTLSITWALGIISWLYFNFSGVKEKGFFKYLKNLAPSGVPLAVMPLIWVIELVSMVIRALTLAVRLYGNMFAGHMVLGIFALATSVFLTSAVQNMDIMTGLPALGWFALLIAMYALETLVAFIQAYVFTILSAVYISLATSSH